LVVGMLIGLAEWARDGNDLPLGLWLPHDDPGNTWANYVREATGRYAGLINHWIIWNEPDVWDTNAPGHTWNGTVEDFAQLQRVSYLAAKEANPAAVIHLAAMTYFWDAQYGREQYLQRLLRVIASDPNAAGHNHYFDVLTAHLYFQPDRLFNVIQEFHGIRAANGIPWKPLWLVETNAPPIDDPTWPVLNWTLRVTQYEQAAFIPQALAVGLAAGAERIAVYKLKDTPGDVAANPEPFGLLRMDGGRRPGFDTYRVAVRYLAGMQGARRERWDEVGQIFLNQGDHSTTILFARLPFPQQAQVTATAATAALVDMWGARQTLAASDGVFTVELPPALCSQPIGDYCMIGGTVYYLVQSAAGGDAPPPPPVMGGGTAAVVVVEVVAYKPPLAAGHYGEVWLPGETPPATATAIVAAAVTAAPQPTAGPLAVSSNQSPVRANPLAESQAAASATPVPEGAASHRPADGRTLSYWFIGAGVLMAVGLAAVWWRGRRS
ncbi:MAG: hypothetical protein AB1791_19730, partial [Chloroflexota bacterium]